MPIDPRIALGVQPPQIQDPMEAYGRVMSLRNMLGQQQIQQQQMQEHQLRVNAMRQQAQDSELGRQIVKKYGGDLEKAQPEIMSVLGERGLAFVKAANDMRESIAKAKKADLDLIEGKFNIIGRAAGAALNSPPEAYQQIRSSLPPEFQQRMPPERPPDEVLTSMLNSAMDAKQQADARRAQLAQEETARHNKATEATAAATREETARHNIATEQTAAKPNTAAELAVIASDPSKTPEEREVATKALKILERHAVASRPQIDLGQNTATEIDPDSQSILAQTGLSQGAFMALTGQMGSLPRDARTRAAAMREAQQWAVKHNVDTSTIASQYKANNEVLAKNIARAANTKIMENELQGTIENLQGVVKSTDLSKLRWANVVKIWGNQEVNDPLAQQYAMHLYQLRQELAAYGAATQGRGGNEINLADLKEAEKTIRNGIDSGSLQGLSTAVKNSTDKMGKVMQGSVVAARRAIWDLFGVGQNFKEPTAPKTDKDPLGIR